MALFDDLDHMYMQTCKKVLKLANNSFNNNMKTKWFSRYTFVYRHPSTG